MKASTHRQWVEAFVFLDKKKLENFHKNAYNAIVNFG
jgi:hypothetical protein